MSFFSAQYIWSQHSRLHFVHANSMKNTYCNEMPFVVFFIPLSTLLSLMSQMDLRHNLRAFASISRVNFSHLKMGSNAVWHFVCFGDHQILFDKLFSVYVLIIARIVRNSNFGCWEVPWAQSQHLPSLAALFR